jgi:hypothetical protein
MQPSAAREQPFDLVAMVGDLNSPLRLKTTVSHTLIQRI